LGLNCTPEDAQAQFEVVVRFCRRTPGRVVVLCPQQQDHPKPEIRAKIYGECFLGKSRSDKRCVEFVMLSYSRSARPFLENQVSICLSTDLPLYYWAHRFVSAHGLADYRYLLTQAKRFMIDSAIATPEVMAYAWPNPAAVRDLAYSRLLPVRQTVGQFLAAYSPAALIEGLASVRVRHEVQWTAEANALLGWLRRRLSACGIPAESVVFTVAATSSVETEGGLGIDFRYSDAARFFRWSADFRTRTALLEADFGGGRTSLATTVSLLEPEVALSEAMFF
jgi:glucose-6-phosphate dehydrogenase assembly protein OpcA